MVFFKKQINVLKNKTFSSIYLSLSGNKINLVSFFNVYVQLRNDMSSNIEEISFFDKEDKIEIIGSLFDSKEGYYTNYYTLTLVIKLKGLHSSH